MNIIRNLELGFEIIHFYSDPTNLLILISLIVIIEAECTCSARDLIKCHPLTPELATELFTSKGMGVFRFSAALIEWSESELNDVKRLCVQAYKNAWHLPRQQQVLSLSSRKHTQVRKAHCPWQY